MWATVELEMAASEGYSKTYNWEIFKPYCSLQAPFTSLLAAEFSEACQCSNNFSFKRNRYILFCNNLTGLWTSDKTWQDPCTFWSLLGIMWESDILFPMSVAACFLSVSLLPASIPHDVTTASQIGFWSFQRGKLSCFLMFLMQPGVPCVNTGWPHATLLSS